ncbi:uncharacterized protein LOC116352020 [Contarinia nasturtii]|uniref:uncharacterized protein LOC116352020 n=1 Tax=Contarinia nasturtii TaxID=265458 RepID=UPI0012D414A1|nr:uncharacterized protein LOC116352020 [Contarinia nasturtii]XP_031640064.1 uncharacterized protein LOC116352020 [Contarinia nasturtii]
MLTKKEKILIQPFIEQNYKKHRRKVQSAQAAVDVRRPTEHPHVLVKLKKIQKERERMQEIERENQRLLQKLSQIMITNRVENFWKEPHPRFLNRVFIKQRAQSVPARKISIPDNTEDSMPPSVKSRGSARCPTCSGKPVISTVKIPEERVPYAPPRKSWNYKLLNDTSKPHRCCKFCC